MHDERMALSSLYLSRHGCMFCQQVQHTDALLNLDILELSQTRSAAQQQVWSRKSRSASACRTPVGGAPRTQWAGVSTGLASCSSPLSDVALDRVECSLGGSAFVSVDGEHMLVRSVYRAAALGHRQHRTFGSSVETVAYDPEQPHLLEQQLLQPATPMPIVVVGAMHDWPARSWSVQNLQQFGGVTIPVEISYNGGDYRDLHAAATTRKFESDVEIPLALLLESMQASQRGQSPADVLLYAAQVDLISLIPELKSGIGTPPLTVINDRLYKRNTWLGPAGTTTPLHCDPYFNLFCQVWGSKYVRMYDQKYAQHLYPFSNPFLRNTSQVRVEKIDAKNVPNFSEVPYLEHYLQPGEMLFLPKKYWHFVQALDASWSVSYWWT